MKWKQMKLALNTQGNLGNATVKMVCDGRVFDVVKVQVPATKEEVESGSPIYLVGEYDPFSSP